MALEAGDTLNARRRALEAAAVHRALGNEWGTAYAKFLIGQSEGDLRQARGTFEESARSFAKLKDAYYEQVSNRALAWLLDELGEREHAQELHQMNLRRASETGNDRLHADALAALSEYELENGKIEEAASMLGQSLSMWQELGDPLNIAEILLRFGRALALDGRFEDAVRVLSGAHALAARIGYSELPRWVKGVIDEALELSRAALDDAAFAKAWQEGHDASTQQVSHIAAEWANARAGPA